MKIMFFSGLRKKIMKIGVPNNERFIQECFEDLYKMVFYHNNRLLAWVDRIQSIYWAILHCCRAYYSSPVAIYSGSR